MYSELKKIFLDVQKREYERKMQTEPTPPRHIMAYDEITEAGYEQSEAIHHMHMTEGYDIDPKFIDGMEFIIERLYEEWLEESDDLNKLDDDWSDFCTVMSERKAGNTWV